MTQEDKELLLKDLSSRLPYGVKFKTTATHTETLRSMGFENYGLIPINLFYKKPEFYLINEFGRLEYKPYLRPMSSMTEDENKEAKENGCIIYWDTSPEDKGLLVIASPRGFDWLNKKMFDYRGLIEKGLALEAPKDMYN